MSLRSDELEQTKILLSDIYSKAGELIFSENIPEEIDNHKPKQSLFPNLEITSTLLVIICTLHSRQTKSGLRNSGFKIPNVSLVAITHRCEGRILLTDNNGLYHDLLIAANRVTCKEMFLINRW